MHPFFASVPTTVYDTVMPWHTTQKHWFNFRTSLATSVILLPALVILCSFRSTLLAQGAPPAPDGERVWRSFLWMKDAPRKNAGLVDAFKKYGISGTNVSGMSESSWQGANKMPFYVGFVAPKADLQLPPDIWKRLRSAAGQSAPLERPSCLHTEETRTRVLRHVGKVVTKALPNRPVAFSLGDEISATLRGAPLDLCFSDEANKQFRDFARRRYGSWEAALLHWGVEEDPNSAFQTSGIRRREFIRSPVTWNFSPWSDRREFMEQTMADFLRELQEEVNRKAPGIPCGITGIGSPDVFGGLNPSRIIPSMSFVEPYDIGGSRELVRSFSRRGSLVVRTLFQNKRDWRFNQHELWDYFLRGDEGVIIWSAKEFFVQRRATSPSAWARRLAPTLRSLQERPLSVYLNATPTQPRIAILELQASNRLHWMLDSREDGPSWIKRLPSYEVENSTQNRIREAWQKLLEDLHFDYVHISPEQLNSSAMEEFDVLILPRCIAMSERVARGIRAFAKKGTVIADCQLALFDATLKAHSAPLLDDLFGIGRDNRIVSLRGIEYTGSTDDVRHSQWLIAEPGVKTVKGGTSLLSVDGHPALIRRSYGDGAAAVYLNLLLTSYLSQRIPFDDDHEILAELRGIIRSASTKPIATVRYKSRSALVPIRLFTRTMSNGDVLLGAIANFRTSGTPIPEDDLLNSPSNEIEILLHESFMVRELQTNLPHDTLVGRRPIRTSRIRTTIPMFEPRIFYLSR